MTKILIKALTCVLLGVGVTFLFACLSFFVFLLINDKSENGTKAGGKTYHYQEISSLDYTTTTNGFTHLNRELSDDEFISYFNPNSDSSVIISNFGENRYGCRGKCFCSDGSRRSSHTLTRSLFIAFSALSSSLALQIASKTFHDQCYNYFSEFCNEQNIETKDLSCSEREHDIVEKEEELEFAEYSCTGYCLPKKAFRSPSTIQAQNDFFEREGKCEELKISGDVKIERKVEKGIRINVLKSGKKKTYPSRYAGMNYISKETFRREYLTNYCKEMSKRSFIYRSPSGQSMRKPAVFCVSGYTSALWGKNIRCTLTSESKIATGGGFWEARKRNMRKTEEELEG